MQPTLNLLTKLIGLVMTSLQVKFRRSLKLPVKPRFINFLLTYQCNSRCMMCNIWQKYQKQPQLKKKELNLAQIKRFLQTNQSFLSKLKNIGLTGGEPLLRPDFVPLVKLFDRMVPHARLGVQTNGLSPDRLQNKIKKILQFRPDFGVAISLDGLQGTHDQVRGIKGAFAKFEQSAKIIKKLGVKNVTVGLTISDLNYREIDQVADLVQKMGFEFSCFLPDVSDYYFDNKENGSLLSAQARQAVSQTLKRFDYHYFMDNLRRQMLGKAKRSLHCYSGYTAITIDPYGEVRACILRPESFGNIKDKPLSSILFDAHGWETRQKLAGCSCWSQCEVSTSALIDIWDVGKWWWRHANKTKFLAKIKAKTNRL